MQSSSSSSSVSAHNRRNKTPDIPQSPGPPPVPTNHDETTEIEGNITANTVMDAYYRILLNDGVIANTVFPDALKAYLTRSEWEHIVIAFASDNITIPQRCCCCTQCYINHGICSHIACFDCCFEVCCDCCDLQQPTSCVGKLRIRCCQHNKCCQEPCLQCAMYCTTFCGCCYAADYFEMLLMRKRLKTESRYLNALLFYNEPVLRIFQNDYITVDMKELLLVYAKKNGLENEDELSSPPVSMLNMKRWVSSSRKKKKQRQQADQAALEEAGGTTLQEYEIVNVSTMEEAVDEEEEEEEFYNFDEIYNQGDFPDDVDTGRPAKNATRRGETSSGKNNTRSKTSPGLGRPVSFSRQMSHKIQGLFGQGSTSSAGVVTSSAADHPELVVHRHLIPNPEVQPQFPSHSIGCPLIVDCGSHTTKVRNKPRCLFLACFSFTKNVIIVLVVGWICH